MLKQIFPNYFYALITPTNTEEILNKIKNAKIDKEKKLFWTASHKQEFLTTKELGPLLIPSVSKFFREDVGYKKNVSVMLQSIWRNTYKKGDYQNLHDHLYGYDDADLSGCIFLEDDNLDASRFYFYNRHQSEISGFWRSIVNSVGLNNHFHTWWISHKAGDILFFPSHMLHGVSQHNLKQPRQTVSFNMKVKI